MSAGALPLYQSAIVSDAKVRDYLLDPSHFDNNGKAQFYFSFGFTRSNWHVLASALKNHPIANPVKLIVPTGFGIKYVVEGVLISPDRRNPSIRSIWIVDASSLFPRLVTAYP